MRASVRAEPADAAVGVAFDLPRVLVDQSVMEEAHEDEVVEVGRAAVGRA